MPERNEHLLNESQSVIKKWYVLTFFDFIDTSAQQETPTPAETRQHKTTYRFFDSKGRSVFCVVEFQLEFEFMVRSMHFLLRTVYTHLIG